MRWLNNQVRFGVAAAVLCGGAAWGAILYGDQPEADRSQAKQIRQLAERIRTQAPPTTVDLSPVSVAPARPVMVEADTEPKVRVKPHAPAIPDPKQPAPTANPAPASNPAPVDPVKNIALMGVTQQGDDGRAWLVDLESHTREVVGEGEEAFGFTVKEIDEESVLLARGTETFNLRLGEKSIPTVSTAAETTESTSGTSGGFGGPGGGDNRDDRRARFAAMMAQMGGSRGGWSGRSWGGSSWRGNSSGGWGSSNSSRLGSSGGRSWGGFSGGGFSGGGFGGGNWGNFSGRNNQNANLNRPTSNPQEARRRKSRLVGGAEAIDEPAAFNNPQTLRRLGRSSGQAFGTSNNGNSQNRR